MVSYEKHRDIIKKQQDSYHRREIAGQAKEWTKTYKPQGRASDTAHEDYTRDLAAADYLMKEGNYDQALTHALHAGEWVLEGVRGLRFNRGGGDASEHRERNTQLTLAEKIKYAMAADKRVDRILSVASESGTGYKIDPNTLDDVGVFKKAMGRKSILKLEKTVATAAILSFGASIFFFSSDVTGNVIGLSNTTSSWIGGILILIGLIALGFWINGKNRKKKEEEELEKKIKEFSVKGNVRKKK
ncbi:MAG: hypothetical protein WCI72_03710 [archaeon]